MRELADLALDAARTAGATYADVRICRWRREELSAREDHVVSLERSESFGFGVRCLVDGAWGFAASRAPGRDEIQRAARAACEMARANRPLVSRPVALVPEPPHLDAWQTPMTKDPFKVPLEKKIDLLLAVNKEAHQVKEALFVTSFLHAVAEEKYFASTEGSHIDQQITRLWPGFTVTARDAAGGDFATRDGDLPPAQRGFEYAEEADLPGLAARAAEEAAELLRAAPVEPGVMDLVLHPTNLWLAIHESVGHPTELDRALGDEADAGGASFARPDGLGTLRYGSDLVNLTADRTMPGGLATAGYDDDGVRTSSWPIVKSGLLAGYPTTRAQAALVGERASRGCASADSWASFPLQRMPNLSLEPSGDAASLEDLIAGVEKGLYIEGSGSWSVDPQRANLQIGAGWARRITKGRLGPPVRDAAYRSGSLDFWRSLDALGGGETWEAGGTFHDLKGEPAQTNAVSHGCPAARFRRIGVLPTGPDAGGAGPHSRGG